MGSLADGLPSRFPIGTRYVVEGRGGARLENNFGDRNWMAASALKR